jgi:hypothetical protein
MPASTLSTCFAAVFASALFGLVPLPPPLETTIATTITITAMAMAPPKI